MTSSTSEVTACRSSASFSSRVSRASSPCSPAGDELAEEALFGVEARRGFDAFGRRARSRLGMILERLFMIPHGTSVDILAGKGSVLKVQKEPENTRSLSKARPQRT
jgi:hypothetical protein